MPGSTVIQNRLLWNFQCPHQKQSHQQIFMMLNRQPFFETPEDWHLKFITMLPRDIIRGVLEVLLHAE